MNSPLPLHHDGLSTHESGLTGTLEDLGHQATDLALDSARGVRDRALQARDSTAAFVQQQPVAALLIAAVGGALVTMLAGLLMRSGAPRR